MLWYKAWIESRARFGVCIALCMVPALNFVFWKKNLLPGDIDGPPLYFKILSFSHIGLAIFWIFSSVLLGLGGLLREKAVGSSPFTLSLPVSRTRMVVVRVA